jgi:AcrR family transcriptional regulator
MSATKSNGAHKPAAKRGPRRMSRGARREHLVAVAMPLVAEQGLSGFSLEEVADRARVTRNLLYHYFPRGREDITVAVAERAGHELTDGWVTDESIPLAERQAANFGRFFDHSKQPSDAWRVYRLARASTDTDLHAMIDQYQDVIVRGIAQNNLGMTDPPPLARMAIKAALAFSETMLDEARESDVPREQVMQVVAQTIVQTLETIRSMLPESTR